MLPLGCHSTPRVLRPYGRSLPMVAQAVEIYQPTASSAAPETSSSTIGGSTTTPTADATIRAHDRETGTGTAIDETGSAQRKATGGSITAPTASAAIRAHDRETGIASATAGGGGIDRGLDREIPTAVAAQLGLPLGVDIGQMSNPKVQGRRPTSVTKRVFPVRATVAKEDPPHSAAASHLSQMGCYFRTRVDAVAILRCVRPCCARRPVLCATPCCVRDARQTTSTRRLDLFLAFGATWSIVVCARLWRLHAEHSADTALTCPLTTHAASPTALPLQLVPTRSLDGARS